MTEPWIELKNVSFRYQDADDLALKNINLTIHRGEKVLVLGANGTGKSTLTKLMANELADLGTTYGEITRHDTHHTDATQPAVPRTSEEKLRHIEMRWQYFFRGYLSDDDFNKLSDGEQSIFHFLKSLNERRDVFIFDDPLKDLSPQAAEVFVDVLDDFYRDTPGCTMIISEHHLEEMMYRPIDRVLVMLDGRVVYDGGLEELLRQNLLSSMGIREPLYITAIRYAGYPVERLEHISDVDRVYGPHLRAALNDWINSVPSFVYPAPGAPILEAKDVRYHYPTTGQRGVEGASLVIRSGEIVSLVGENGSGKTTLGRLLSGVIVPDAGGVYWRGERVTAANVDRFKQEVPFVPQQTRADMLTKTVAEWLDWTIAHYHLAFGDPNQAKQWALTQLEPAIPADAVVGDLSRVDQQRAAIACSLLRQPKVLIVESAAEREDFAHFRRIMQDLYRLNMEHGLTILMTTRDIESMLEYTRRSIVMSEGRILTDATPVKVITTPEIVDAAALRETSLNRLADQLDLVDPYTFIQKFMDYDREVQQLL